MKLSLEELGSRLIIRRSSQTFMALAELLRETGATAVFFNNLYDPISMVRDHSVKQSLTSFQIPFYTFNSDLLFEPWDVLDSKSQTLSCFEDFWSHCRSHYRQPALPVPGPGRLPTVPMTLTSIDVEDLGLVLPEEKAYLDVLTYRWSPGEAASASKVKNFMRNAILNFDADENKADRSGTSQLSPHIHYGEVSVRLLWHLSYQIEAEYTQHGIDSEKSFAKFRRHLGLRDYSRYLSYHYPYTHERAMLQHLQACPWRYNKEHFRAWQEGKTGYPLVDAGMRELAANSWINNRLRRLTASFLIKTLLLPWQWGLKYYWDALLDADIEQDSLGWQYVSGGIVDGLSFDTIDDYDFEGRQIDPDGVYIKHWIPELTNMPSEYIHSPWKAPQHILESAGVCLGPNGNYTYPLVLPAEAQSRVEKACRVIEEVMSQQITNDTMQEESAQVVLPEYPQDSNHTTCNVPVQSDSAGMSAGICELVVPTIQL